MLILVLFALLNFEYGASFNHFPSLLIANATMAVVVERPFFELKAVKKKYATMNAYEKKLEGFVKAITEASRTRTNGSHVGIEMSVFQETSANLGRDYTVLLSVASCDATWNLFERARKENLVHLAITDSDCPRLPIDHGLSVVLVQPGQELSQLLLDLRVNRIFTWKKVNFLHDRILDRDTISKVIRVLFGKITNLPHLGISSQSLFSIQVSNLSLSARKRVIVETLKKFPSRSDDRFLVIVTQEYISSIIESARSLGMLRPENEWLFILPDAEKIRANISDFKRYLNEGENIAFIYNATYSSDDCMMSLECYAKDLVSSVTTGIADALRQEKELYEKVTDEEFDFLRLTKTEKCSQIINFIREDLYNPREKNREAKKCLECVMWKIMTGLTWGNSFDRKNSTEVHKLLDVGHWTPGEGVFSRDLLFPHTKHGFRKKVLPIVTYHNPPWQYVEKSKKTGNFEWNGIVFEIVNELSERLNFTYKVVELGNVTIESERRREISEKFDNRSNAENRQEEFLKALTASGRKIPDEVTELVHNRQVFIGACAATVAERLKSLLNFTIPISVETYCLLAPRPKPLSRAMLFAAPYTTESWACLAGTILLTGPILYLVHQYSANYLNISENISSTLGSPARCLWYIYGALLQQGGMRLPKNDGARLIVGTWWLVVMIVVATYSGSLVAFLTFPRMEESVSSLDDLLRHRETLTWSLPAGSYLLKYLMAGKNGPYDDLLNGNFVEEHNYTNYKDIVNRIKEGKHVLIDWKNSLTLLTRMDNPLTNDGICHFSIGTESFFEESIALILPVGSPYLNLINKNLKRMNEVGLIGKWIQERMPKRDECWEGSKVNNEVKNHKVDIWDMQGIFFVLFLGYSVALLFLTGEFLYHYRNLVKQRKLIRPFVT